MATSNSSLRRYQSAAFIFVALWWVGAGAQVPATPAKAKKATNKIVRYSPVSDRSDNRVSTANQVVVDFGENMIKLGEESSKADIFDVNCSPHVDGSASWNSLTEWTYNFQTSMSGSNLPAATECAVSLHSNVKTVSGKSIIGTRSFKFLVDGPNIVAITPDANSGNLEESAGAVSDDQAFVIETDPVVRPDSIEPNVYFHVAGAKASRVGVKLVTGRDRDDILKNSEEVDQDHREKYVVVRPVEHFPANAKIDLVFGPGVRALQSNITRVVSKSYSYSVRDRLTAKVSCTKETMASHCSPISDVVVTFSAPVLRADAEKAYLLLPGNARVSPTFNDDGDTISDQVSRLTFKMPFPEKADLKIYLPDGLHDEEKRPLANRAAFNPMIQKTSALPPLLKFSGRFGIVESKLEAKDLGIPVTIRNVEAQALGRDGTPDALTGSHTRVGSDKFAEVISWLRKVNSGSDYAPSQKKDEQRDKSILPKNKKLTDFKIPLLKGPTNDPKVAYDTVGLVPLKAPGFYVVEMQSKILGSSLIAPNRTMYVSTSALVTNLSVHVKQGSANSLFWVTSLNEGQPVAGATVALYGCDGKQVWSGTSDAQGLARYSEGSITKLLPTKSCETAGGYGEGYFVTATSGNDFTFTYSGWTEGIESSQFGIYGTYPGAISDDQKYVAHTVTDRALLHAGETVSTKTFIRSNSARGLGTVPASKLPAQIVFSHDGDDTSFAFPITWDSAEQVALFDWSIPSTAKLGPYSISLAAADGTITMSSGRIQVQDFTPPLTKAQITFPKDVKVNPSSVNVTMNVDYFNGGPVKNLPASFKYTITPMGGFFFQGYDEFHIGNGGVEAKVERSTDGPGVTPSEPKPTPIVLDDKGMASVTVRDIFSGTNADTLQAERITSSLEYRDTVGKTQTITKVVTVYPSSTLAAIQMTNSYTSDKNPKFQVGVFNLDGTPKAGATAKVSLMQRITYSHRTRLLGGVYSSETVTETKAAPATFKCAGATDDHGKMECSLLNAKPGVFFVVASTTDDQGLESRAHAYLHVSGSSDDYNPSGPDDRIDLLANKKEYNPGESARLEAKFPLTKAKVLVTVEREGILEAHVVDWSTAHQYVDVKIEPGYSPNIYVSAFAVQGRINGQSDESKGTIDLGKPTFKMGLTKVAVSKKEHELLVKVTPGVKKNDEFSTQSNFGPRDPVDLDVRVTDSNGHPVKGEVALAVVDEGLLALLPNKSWDVLKQLLTERPLSVVTATAQMQVIGKRNASLKAVPLGGDGAAGAPTQGLTRELMDTLLTWVGRAKLDENGHVALNSDGTSPMSFKLNDKLSAFRVVVIATSGLDKFGRGEATIKSSKDFEIESAMSKMARTGDSYDAEFSLRNTTDKAKKVDLSGVVRLTMYNGTMQSLDLPAKSVQVGPGERVPVVFDKVSLPSGVTKTEFTIKAQGEDKSQLDSLQATQSVSPDVLPRPTLGVLEQITGKLAPMPVSKPANAIEGVGGVSVKLMDSLTGSLSTLQNKFDTTYFDDIEIRASKAVALSLHKDWAKVTDDLPGLLDDSGLVKYFSSSKTGSASLTAYLLKIAKESGLEIPKKTLTQMTEGLKGFAEGKSHDDSKRSNVESFVVRLNAIDALSRYNVENSASLAALPRVDRADLPNGSLIQLVGLYDRFKMKKERDELADTLRSSRITTPGGTLETLADDSAKRNWEVFNTQDSDYADLISTLTNSDDLRSAWATDLPKLIKATRDNLSQGKGSWDSTMADALMALAYRDFSKKTGNDPITGTTLVDLGDTHTSVNWSSDKHDEIKNFAWPASPSEISITHQGGGQPWAMISSTAAVPLTQTEFAGITKFEKTLKPVRQAHPPGWSREDIVQVTLTIKSNSPLAQLAVMDPIPAGAQILGNGLENSSQDNAPVSYADFDEAKEDGYRAYFSFTGTDDITIVYSMQLNNTGTFKLPASVAEATFNPEVHALKPNNDWVIGQ